MLHDISYRISLGWALALHVILLFLLLSKFIHPKPKDVFMYSGNIIQAEVVSSAALTSFKKDFVVAKQLLPDSMPELVQRNLLIERDQELVTLKKDKQKRMRKIIVQQKQQMEHLLQKQLAVEKQQLVAAAHDQQQKDARQVDANTVSNSGLLPGVVEKHHDLVKRTISAQWIKPEGTAVGDMCQLLVNVAPGGVVLNVKLLQSSGKEVFDRSAQAAVIKSSPLPVPEDVRLFDEFRTIKLTFREEGILNN